MLDLISKSLIGLAIMAALLLGGADGLALADNYRIEAENMTVYTTESKISDVIHDPVFGDFGRLLFPVDGGYWSGETLRQLRLTWYSHIDPAKTVEIVNYLHGQAAAGQTVFYPIYTAEEIATDPAKADTGLFFFRGEPGARFAICNAGGGFAYVGAMHDSFPHALELSKKGYNAFALIYRPGAQTACEDLARAISFILKTPKSLVWTPTATHFGAVLPGPEWRLGWVRLARRSLAAALIPSRER